MAARVVVRRSEEATSSHSPYGTLAASRVYPPLDSTTEGTYDDDETEEEDEGTEGEDDLDESVSGDDTSCTESTSTPVAASRKPPMAPDPNINDTGTDTTTSELVTSDTPSNSSYSMNTSTAVGDNCDARRWEAQRRRHSGIVPAPVEAVTALTTVALTICLGEVSGLQLNTNSAFLTCSGNLTLVHVGLRRFFGRTYTTGSVKVAMGNDNQGVTMRLDASSVVFHTKLMDSDVALVVEIFTQCSNPARNSGAQRGLGWAALPLDLPAFHPHPSTHRLDVWCPMIPGTPRCLLGPSAPPPPGSAKLRVQVSALLQRPRWEHLVPLDVLFGPTAPIPGLDFLARGKIRLQPTFRLTIGAVTVVVPEKTERRILRQAFRGDPPRGLRVVRKLRLSVHNSVVTVGSARDLELRSADRSPGPNHPHSFRGSVHFNDFPYHPSCALLCEYLYELYVSSASPVASSLCVLVGTFSYLPCRDTHVPYGGIRMIQGHLALSETISTAQACLPAADDVANGSAPPFYLTFEASGEPSKSLCRARPQGPIEPVVGPYPSALRNPATTLTTKQGALPKAVSHRDFQPSSRQTPQPVSPVGHGPSASAALVPNETKANVLRNAPIDPQPPESRNSRSYFKPPKTLSAPPPDAPAPIPPSRDAHLVAPSGDPQPPRLVASPPSMPADASHPQPPVFFHSVHALPRDPLLALSPADQALLQSIRFAPICSGTDGPVILGTRHGTPEQATHMMPVPGARTAIQTTGGPPPRWVHSDIVVQPLAFLTPRSSVAPLPTRLLLKFYFYNFGLQVSPPLVTDLTPHREPVTPLNPPPADSRSPALQVLWTEAVVEGSPAGYQFRLRHSPATDAERRRFLEHLRTATMYIDVCDARSMFRYGCAAIRLAPIARTADQTFCIHTEEVPVVACEEHHFPRDDALATGSLSQCTVNQTRSELGLRPVVGRLLLRIANVGVEGPEVPAPPLKPHHLMRFSGPKMVPRLEELCKELTTAFDSPEAQSQVTEAGSLSKKELRLLAFRRQVLALQCGDGASYGFPGAPLSRPSLGVIGRLPSVAGPEDLPSAKWAAAAGRLTTLDVFRETQRRHTLQRTLWDSISDAVFLDVVFGYVTFFEVVFTNPYKDEHCFTFHITEESSGIPSTAIQPVCDLEEWRSLCLRDGYPAPSDRIPTASTICGGAGAEVRLPLKARCLTPSDAVAGPPVAITVAVCCAAGVCVRHVVVTLRPQPMIVHRAVDLFARDSEPLVRWLFVSTAADSLVARPSNGSTGYVSPTNGRTKWAVCSDSYAQLTSFVHHIDRGGARMEDQEYVELRLPGRPLSAGKRKCYITLYNDSWMNEVWEVWALTVMMCPSLTVETHVGCRNTVWLPLHDLVQAAEFDAQDPSQVAFATSHPEFRLVMDEAADPLQLQATYHPRFPTHTLFLVNAVELRRSAVLGTLVVEVRATHPPPTRLWSESIPPLGRKPLVRRIPFQNLHSTRKAFVAFTPTPQNLRITPPTFALDSDETETLTLIFSNVDTVGRWVFLVFINTAEDDQTEECLEATLTVVDLTAPLLRR